MGVLFVMVFMGSWGRCWGVGLLEMILLAGEGSVACSLSFGGCAEPMLVAILIR